MIKTSAVASILALGLVAGCASQTTQTATGPVVVRQDVTTPPPVVTTPVPIVHAKSVSGAGRSDPFVALFGPPEQGSAPSKVAVSTFPNIPTLPGFGNAPAQNDMWSTVKLTGVIQHGGFIAILEADGKSYFVRPGDRVGDRFRVLSVGPDYITLATDKEERHFSLGG